MSEEVEFNFDEFKGPEMSPDEARLWSDAYITALKSIMYRTKSINKEVVTTITLNAKMVADKSLGRYREKKLDVER